MLIAALLLLPGPGCADAGAWLAALDRADTTLASTTGYTATFHKAERIGDTLVTGHVYRLKFMRPFSVYLEWVNPGGRGGEAIYVEGRNRNRVRVHPGGFWGILNFNLRTDSRWLMKDSRHPITFLGLHNLTRLIGDNVRRAIAAGTFESADHGEVVIFGRTATALEGTLPADPAAGYWCRKTLVYFDRDTGLPVNIRNWDRHGDLLEEYGYADLQINNALSASDFDPDNPAYRF